MIVTLTDNAVVALSTDQGKVLWLHPYQNSRQNHCVTPIFSEGQFYVTSGYGKGAIGLALANDGQSVKQIWAQPKQDPIHGQAVLVDVFVYASSHQAAAGRWSCVDFKTGKLMWEAPCVGKGGSIIYADGMLYCYSQDGVVGLVRPNPDQCKVVSAFNVSLGDGPHWAHPVVAHGRLFIRHGDALMCYNVKAR
jgi:outer membrane protein assembly factor BamB